MFVRGLIYLGLLFGAYLSVKAIAQKVVDARNSGHVAGKSDDIMVKDPSCNVYFPKREGIHLRDHDGQDLYFCSEECKNKFIENS